LLLSKVYGGVPPVTTSSTDSPGFMAILDGETLRDSAWVGKMSAARKIAATGISVYFVILDIFPSQREYLGIRDVKAVELNQLPRHGTPLSGVAPRKEPWVLPAAQS
jgi:hypothetical protein